MRITVPVSFDGYDIIKEVETNKFVKEIFIKTMALDFGEGLISIGREFILQHHLCDCEYCGISLYLFSVR